MAKKKLVPALPQQYTVEVLGRSFPVSDMLDASKKVSYLRDTTGMGASEMGGQFPVRESDVVIGYVSYNGKVWKGSPESREKAQLMYDPYAQERHLPIPPVRLAIEREPQCWAHTNTKDYTRRGERFVRCGWCDARRVETPATNPEEGAAWWRVVVSYVHESCRRIKETHAFFDTKDGATKRAIKALGPDFNYGGRVDSVTQMAGPPEFKWRR